MLNLLRCEDLRQVLLVGHSYGGIVITGVADRAPGSLAHLVYLDAFVPENGQSLLDVLPAPIRARFEERTRDEGEGWRAPSPPFMTEDPVIAVWAKGRYGPQPILTLRQPLRLARTAGTSLARAFVSCTGKPAGEDLFALFAARARQDAHWGYRELPSIHDAQITMPRGVADLLGLLVED